MPAVSYIYQDDLSNPWSYCLFSSDDATQGWIGWPLANGSILNINPPECDEQADLTSTLSGFSSAYPNPNIIGFTAYSVGAVQVTTSAIGAPWCSGFGIAFGLDYAYGNFPILGSDPSFDYALQCFPVLSLNPVQCRTAGEVQIGENSLHVITPNCNVSTPIYGVDPQTQGATAAGICPVSSVFGRARALLGATNSHATTLAEGMWDDSFNPPANSSFSYAVACDVDIAPQIAVRPLILDKLSVSLSSTNICSGVDTETMVNTAKNDSTLLYGMAGLYPLLVENTYRDGSLDLLWSQVDLIVASIPVNSSPNSTPTLLFTNSKTPLEDALGCATGMALGFHWGGDTRYSELSQLDFVTYGEIRFFSTRIGSGRWYSVLFILPSLYSLTLLAYLFWYVRKAHS